MLFGQFLALHLRSCSNDKLILTTLFFFGGGGGGGELSGGVLDSRGFQPHGRHCVVVLEQDTFILA